MWGMSNDAITVRTGMVVALRPGGDFSKLPLSNHDIIIIDSV